MSLYVHAFKSYIQSYVRIVVFFCLFFLAKNFMKIVVFISD